MDSTPSWPALFPDRDFRFNFGAHPGNAAAFFAPTAEHPQLVRERAHWLQTSPAHCLLCRDEAAPLIAEAMDCAEAWGDLSPDERSALRAATAPAPQCHALGRVWEPDWLLLNPDDAGRWVLLAAAVCFPSTWRPEEKLGLPLSQIHAPVPTLNESLGAQIDKFIGAILPGTSWERSNWGLSRSSELCQHPARNLPRLTAPLRAEQVWVRIENQVLHRLPQTGGLLFGIRLENVPLSAVKAHATAAPGLQRALRTMPDEVAHYKGLHAAREELIALLA